MEVLFRCISIFLQQPEPGKENEIHIKNVSQFIPRDRSQEKELRYNTLYMQKRST